MASSTLTAAQRDQLRERLERERARILRVLGSSAVTAPQSDQETELEEAAQRTAERTGALELEARERALLADVEHALAKFATGEYGIGERSGDPIPYERLVAVPWAREPVAD